MRPASFRVKLSAWYFAVLAATFAAFAVVAWWTMRASLYGAVDADVMERAAGVAKQIERLATTGGSGNAAAALGAHVGLDDALQIRERSRGWVYRAPLMDPQVGLVLPPADPAHRPVPATVRIGGRPFRAVSVRVLAGGRDYIVEVGARLDSADAALARFRSALVVAAPMLLLVASAGGYWLSRRALAPVDDMARAARDITARSLSRRLRVPQTGDELQRLSETLNGMLERLDAAFDRVTQFTADAAHELRTPVAVMRTVAEVALRRPRTEAEMREALAQVHTELERVGSVVEDLLQLARADAGVQRTAKLPVPLGASLRRACRLGAALGDIKCVQVGAPSVDGEITILGDAALLDRLFVILVDNAVKYSDAGARVDVRAAADASWAVVEVRDTGRGIAAADLPRIWERFYRCDKAHSGDSGGSGLGLAIARWIVDSHAGEIAVESALGQGSVFRVRLPLSTDLRRGNGSTDSRRFAHIDINGANSDGSR